MFIKYQHIERFGNEEVLGIELGKAYIFPKLDGTNASCWFDNELFCGSRNRQLSIESDNAGFLEAQFKDERLYRFFQDHSRLRLFGEWLVPHTLKTYRDDAWRRFYIFDVFNDDSEQYLSYEEYKPLLEVYNLDYIPPLAIIKNGSYENFIHVLNQNNFFIKDGEGLGEGIVIKNYEYYNKFGRQIWAKIVSSEFKEQHSKTMGAPETEGKMVEEEIVDGFLTPTMIEKTYQKIHNDHSGWSSKYIPQLLETVYYDFIREETYEWLKQLKNPTINFKTLKSFVIMKIKNTLPEVF